MKDNKQDKKEFSKIMIMIASESSVELTPLQIETKFNELKEYDLDIVLKAGKWLLRNREKDYPPLPTIKEFIDAIKEKHNKPDIKSIAQIQADIAIKALKKYGGSRIETEFEHPVTNYLMTHKWNYKIMADTILISDFKSFRMEFIGIFKAYSEQDKVVNDKQIGTNNKQISGLTNNMLKEIN